MSTPQWSGPVVYCKECGMQKHPEMRCPSEKCNKGDRMTESEKMARAIAEDFAEKFYGLKNRGHSAYMETTIARALEDYADKRVEEALHKVEWHCRKCGEEI